MLLSMNLYFLLNLFPLLFLCLSLIPFLIIVSLVLHYCLLLILFIIMLLSQTLHHLLIPLFLKIILLIFLRAYLFLFLMTLLIHLIFLMILCPLFLSLSLPILLLPLQLVLFFVILYLGGLLGFLDHLLTFKPINAMLLPPSILLPIISLVTNSLLLTPIFAIVYLLFRNQSFTIKQLVIKIGMLPWQLNFMLIIKPCYQTICMYM